MKKIFAFMAVAALVAGCGVNKQLYEEKVNALGACEQNLSAASAERDKLQNELETAKAELSTARSEADKYRSGQYGCEAGLKRAESELKKAQADLAAAQEKLKNAGSETERQELNLALKGCRDELSSSKAELERAKKEADALRQREIELKAKLEKEMADKKVDVEKQKGSIAVKVLDSVLFDQGTAEIKASGGAILDKLASTLSGSKDTIRVEGHTDDMAVGPAIKDKWPSNWELSSARAASVVRYFQWGKNIDPARMEAVGRAQYHPAAPNDGEKNRAQNRRVVIILTPAQQ
ncbi:hypothetical protein FDZ71_08530 [bacterium]|nr:MAG: hypothetical protein FDZ71_08530 [bacterium]